MALELEPPLGQFAKGQTVRLFDILVLGPSLMYIGFRQKDPVFRWSLIASGFGTIVYNYKNWERYCQAAKKVKEAYARQGMAVPDVVGDLGCAILTTDR